MRGAAYPSFFLIGIITGLFMSPCVGWTPSKTIPYEPTLLGGVVDSGFILTKYDAEVHWDESELPIKIILDFKMRGWKPEVDAAIETWNYTIGRDVFEFAGYLDTGPDDNYAVAPYVFVKPGKTSYTMLNYDHKTGRLKNANVFLSGDYSKELALERDFMVTHEFGHVLGLDHDNIKISIMRPNLYGGPLLIHITNSDVAALMAMYNFENLYENVETSTITE